MHLYEQIAARVDEWRARDYPHSDYPAIAEILEYAANPEGSGFRLRPPQVRALETYWYLRLVENTPHIFDLYKKYFPKRADMLAALGIPSPAFERADYDMPTLLENIKSDDDFVREFKLEALRETMTLDYASYILALAMGAGKTILIGAIFASEFAMAFEYPDANFVQNALVFAPGKTIIESLRQLLETRFDRILPPRFFKPFAASVKFTFTRDGEKDIPVIRSSIFNVVVTNTEKIRIQKPNVRAAKNLSQMKLETREEQEQEIANLRLQAIASLPHLAVFSDEAHHTYGQSLDTELKKVRKTVDYIADNTNVICVINTTGTPYFQKQPLRDVVIWYGLSQGIRDQILKEVGENIRAYEFEDNIEAYIANVIEDFFRVYGEVTLPDGTPAKLAMYFPQTDDVAALRPVIDQKLVELNLSPTLVLEHHTANDNPADFNRFKSKDSPHRVVLLVDRGVEGWDAPALFACALARKLKTSNNFVLQAASRCLRQVAGNNTPARIYLSSDNRNVLDKELKENYGESLQDLTRTTSHSRYEKITLKKINIPPLVVKQIVRTIVRKENAARTFALVRPTTPIDSTIEVVTFTLSEQRAQQSVLQQVSNAIEIQAAPKTMDLYSAAVELAANYRLELWTVLDELRRVYDNANDLPIAHLSEIAQQIEEQTRAYEEREEVREIALALVKPDGFDKTINADGTETYTAEISYPISREDIIARVDEWRDKAGAFGFHYDPYNFDSRPEADFFEQVLRQLNLHPDNIEDIYFTGALTDSKKTDFRVEYKGEDNKWHDYTPDFIIRRKDGKCLIVEIKSAQFKNATEQDMERAVRGEPVITLEGRKAMALKKWEQLDPDKLKYEILFAGTTVEFDQLQNTREFIKQD